MQLIQQMNIHSIINTSTPTRDTIMRLNEIAEDLEQRRIELLKSNAEITKQETAYAKSAQAWFKMQRAKAEEQKARQRFIQAAVAFSRSSHP
jgi:formiminotetrahydrofolate cyclodeaminase